MSDLNIYKQKGRLDQGRHLSAAFTLVELLVVMAITVILLGLIFGPMVQSFNLTTRARVQVEAQDTSRRVLERVQRDVSESVFVFDNIQQPINFWMPTPDANGEPTGPAVPQPVYGPYLDIVKPAQIGDQSPTIDPGNIDPTTGQAFVRGAIGLPMTPGRTIVRYFMGLRGNASVNNKPIKPYYNYYDKPNLLILSNHNPMILYRVEIAPFTAGGKVDTRFFRTNAAGQPILYDPNFFYDTTEAIAPTDPTVPDNKAPGWKDLNGDGKVNLCENWKAIANPLVPMDRSDLALIVRDADRKPVFFVDPLTSLTYTKVSPLATFIPAFKGNDGGSPASTGDAGNEAPTVAPASFRQSYGYWTMPFNLIVYRGSMNGPVYNYFVWDGSSASVKYATYDAGTGSTSSTDAMFYPSRFNPLARRVDLTNLPLSRTLPPLIMMSADARKGTTNFAFPDWIWLYDDATGLPLPTTYDPVAVNAIFDSYVAANPENMTNAIRYVNLQDMPDGRTSPLKMIQNCVVVPGTEVVKGPDMRPGPHYGKEITYTRVPRGSYRQPTTLGANEYMINFTNQPNYNPSNPDIMENNRLRAGTIIFPSQPNVVGSSNKLPELDADGNPPARITVTYQMQNNLTSDTVQASYNTRQILAFSLGVRLYELSSGQPQQVNLTGQLTIRNLQR